MAEHNIDILMMIVKAGQAIKAECSAVIDPKDNFMDGFSRGKFFQVDDFDFGISLTDSDETAKTGKNTTLVQGNGTTSPVQAAPRGGRFSKWVQGQGATNYTIEMEPFGFTRQIDSASIPLFYSCFGTKSFDSAAVVLRKAGGLQNVSSGLSAVPYMRIDFKQILIVSIDWDGGEIVKEKCKFVCRQVAVKYRQQLHSGEAGDPLGGDWLSLQKSA